MPSQLAEEPKRPRLYASTPLDDFGGFGLDLTQPPDEPQQSPELAVEVPSFPVPAAPDIVHELSQRVALNERVPIYEEIHARLARLQRLDDASVGKALSKGELLCLLSTNGIACKTSAHKGAVVAELLIALKEKRIGSTLADAQQRALARLVPEEEDPATQPPDDLDAAASDAVTQMPTAANASALIGAAIDPCAAASTEAGASKQLLGARTTPASRGPPPPPASLTSEEEDFVWKLLTGALEPLGAKASSTDGGSSSRSVHTQTEHVEFGSAAVLSGGAGGFAPPYSQLQSQACVAMMASNSQPYCSNGGGNGGRDMEGLVSKCRKLLKASPYGLADDEIRDALIANSYNVMQAVDSLRAKASARDARAHENTSNNLVRTWEERLARGSL